MFREGPEGFKEGLSAGNYINLTRASRATATRDLQDLVDLGALTRTGERKHTRYYLNVSRNSRDIKYAPHESFLCARMANAVGLLTEILEMLKISKKYRRHVGQFGEEFTKLERIVFVFMVDGVSQFAN